MIDKKKIALVGPSFFAYIEAIRNKLADRGFEARFFDERHANSIRVKILYRLGFYARFPGRKNRHLDHLIAQIRAGDFTDALLIDVEVCDARFVQLLTEAGVRVHLYMWDSARNKPRYLSYLHLLHGKSSFDPEDCATYGLTYIPLFAEDVFSARLQALARSPDRPVDISFCGTLHSNRARYLTELMRFAKRRGLKVSLLLYFHSRWLLAIKSIVNHSNARFFRTTSTTGFSKQQIFTFMARSKFVFDLPHPGQLGLTARTFEVLRSGTRLITVNKTARTHLPASLAERVFVIRSIDELNRIDFSAPCPSSMLSDTDDYLLSIDRFVDQILGVMEHQRFDHPSGARSAHHAAVAPAADTHA